MSMTTTTARGYCLKCLAQRDIKSAVQLTLKNGRPALEGACAVCGTKVFTIGGTD